MTLPQSNGFDALAWYEDMLAAQQQPLLASWWGDDRAQLVLAGRDYDDNLDQTRWSQIKPHHDAVVSFLRARKCWVTGFEPDPERQNSHAPCS